MVGGGLGELWDGLVSLAGNLVGRMELIDVQVRFYWVAAGEVQWI